MEHKHYYMLINNLLFLMLILLSCGNEPVPVEENKGGSSFENRFEIRWFYQGQVDIKVSEWFNDPSTFHGNISSICSQKISCLRDN